MPTSFHSWVIPVLFYGGSLLMAAWLWLSTYPRFRGAGLASNYGFGLVCLLLLLIGRWPGLLFAEALNVDEGQLAAQAITLLRDPVYWQSVDGTTIGPLNSYLLCWPGWLGLPITYATTRLTALLVIAGTAGALYAGLRQVTGQLVARRAVILLLGFYVFSRHADFGHFSSELLANLLLTALWWPMLRGLNAARPTNRPPYWPWLLVGLLAGLVPYAKLQAVPIAAALGGYVLYWLVQQRNWRAIGWLAGAAAVPTVLLLLGTSLAGVTERFWLFYIESNLFNYGEYNSELFPLAQQPLWQKVGLLPALFSDEKVFLALTISVGVSLLLLLLRPVWPAPARLPWAGVLLWTAAALFCYLKPGTYFQHHLQLLVIPMIWLLALAQETERVRPAAETRLYAALTALPALLFALVFTGHAVRYGRNPDTINQPLWTWQRRYVRPENAVVHVLKQHARPTDLLVVWGWNMTYHVDTQLGQGVSENHSFRSIMPHSLRDAYQQKYLDDMQRTRPALFVDAVGPSSLWMTNVTRFRHEQFPALDRYVQANYTLVEQIGTERIYLRNDRLKIEAEAVSANRPAREL